MLGKSRRADATIKRSFMITLPITARDALLLCFDCKLAK